jgi:hypothetical protein
MGLLVSSAGAAPVTVGLELAAGQTGQVSAAGQTVTMNLYAYMAGTDTNKLNDGIQEIYGALKSTGALAGNLALSNVNPLLQASGWTAGTVQDLNGNGGMDIGATNTQASAGWIHLYAGGGASAFAPTTDDPNKVLLAQVTFTATDVSGASATVAFNFRNQTGLGNGIEGYVLDGALKNVAYSASNAMAAGSSVTITPEPATMAILAIGGLGVLLRRRRAA